MNRLSLFPDTTCLTETGMSIGGCDLAALAEEYGTPLYLYDQATLVAAAEAYRRALATHYPAESGITYAGKAFLCLAMAQWTQQQGLWLDCTGEGEISIAVKAGVKREHLLVHGVNKSPADLKAACQHAETIVVDHITELELLLSMQQSNPIPDIWLRFQPEVEVETHTHIQTGQAGSKFGMGAEEIRAAIMTCKRVGVTVKGLHFHLGSQIRQTAPLEEAIARALELAAGGGFRAPWTLSPGGGWGVAYNEEQLPQPGVEEYIRSIAGAVVKGCQRQGLPLPRLQVEPGRSLAARAGVALYRAGAVKQARERTWVLLDGGLADNPRHALYGVNYSAVVVNNPNAQNTTSTCLAGPYCESGDVISMDLPMPQVKAGELIVVPVSGAYQLSMASNYNGACRPAVVWLKDGRAYLIQEREKPVDLWRRDHLVDE